MDTAIVIGNGESRLIYPIQSLRGHAHVYGCNAIFRTNPTLCDTIVSVDHGMHREMMQSQLEKKIPETTKLIGPAQLPDWDYILPQDSKDFCPQGLDFYRFYVGRDAITNGFKLRDLSRARGSGCCAVLRAAESNHRHVLLLGFDLLGSRQWEMQGEELSRSQNNVYRDSPGYPQRESMKGYLKYEWLYQLTQIFRKYPNINFYFINRREYVECNPLLPKYFSLAPGNVKAGIYANLKKYMDGNTDMPWYLFKKGRLIKG